MNGETDSVRPDRRRSVATAILGVLLIGGYFAASRGDLGALPTAFIVNAIVLGVGFWIPAMRIGRPGDVAALWKQLALWVPGWTLVWDLGTSGLVANRSLFEEWWIVYPAGIAFFTALLLLHGLVTARFAGPTPADSAR